MTSALAKSLARVAARCHRMNHVAENRVSSSIVRNVDLRFRRERHGVREYDPRSVSEAFTESGDYFQLLHIKKGKKIESLELGRLQYIYFHCETVNPAKINLWIKLDIH